MAVAPTVEGAFCKSAFNGEGEGLSDTWVVAHPEVDQGREKFAGRAREDGATASPGQGKAATGILGVPEKGITAGARACVRLDAERMQKL